MQNH